MRLLNIWLILGVATVAALAQPTNRQPRKLGLEDCIEIALRHNLDLEIKRLDPQIARFNLNSLYGAYDPTFSAAGEHDYTRQPGSVDSNGRAIPGAEIETDRYSGGFAGLLPWGTTYNLGLNIADQTTFRPAVSASGGPFTVTNTFYNAADGTPISFYSTNFPASVPALSAETWSGQAGALQLRQPLLKNFWVDNTRLQIFLDKKNVQISELGLRSQLITTVTAVEDAYYNLISAQDSVKVQEKATELAERLVVENKKRVEVGAMAPLEEKQAESQAAGTRADLIAAQATEDTDQRVLKILLSDDYEEWKNVVIEPAEALMAVPEPFDLQESWRRGLTQRPDLLQQKVSLEKQGFIIRYQKNQLYPQLDLVGSYGYNASSASAQGYFDQLGSGNNPFYSFGAQMSIPLTQTSARNNFKSAKATKEQIELQLKQLQQNIMVEIENSIANARSSFQRVGATREARIYAEAALDAEQKKLESGKSTSFEVLRLQRDLTSARSAEIAALADYNRNLAQLALSEGSTLDRRKVRLEKR